MKTPLTIVLTLLFSFTYGQIFKIKEMPEYNLSAINAVNKLRDSLKLSVLEEDSILVSTAKHHAYYLVYGLSYDKYMMGHGEDIDIPNFEEIPKAVRLIYAKDEIQSYYGISFKLRDTVKDIVKEADKNILKDDGCNNFGEFYVKEYKESESHYRIMITKDRTRIGTFSLLVYLKSDNEEFPMLYLVSVTNTK